VRQDSEAERPFADRRRLTIVFLASVSLLLGFATLAIYFQTYRHDFVSYDDGDYVYGNVWVSRGLRLRGVIWAITALYINWHPLTWLSHMLDVELFGLTPGPEHLVNVAFHMASTILLLVALSRMTGKPGRSALVSAVFAVHPLHVESVAWIAERKDVLSTFFEVLTLLFYAGYARNRTMARYVAVVVAFACALMSKPMAVTFPFVLLLLDYWPLGRTKVWPVIREKIPLFAMSFAAGVLTMIAQRRSGAVISLGRVPFGGRLANAAIASVWYARKAIWPAKLACFYPLQPARLRDVVLSLMALAIITSAARRWQTRRPYFLVGWLWYLGMLVPVIGIVQVGLQSVADRYSYMPLTGLSIAFIWLIADALSGRFVLQGLGVFLATVGLAVLAVAAWRQTSWWKDGETLYRHATAVTQKNYLMESNLGAVLSIEGRHAEAIEQYRRAIADRPDFEPPYANLGGELLDAGRVDEASVALKEALRINPEMELAQSNLGSVYKRRGDYAKARELLVKALGHKPDDAFAQSDLCFVMAKTESDDEAIAHCREAIRLRPRLGEAYVNLARILADQGNKAAAAGEYERLLAVLPSYPGARAALDDLKLR
jgi:tetratricopeptide (TPR) repeat protein